MKKNDLILLFETVYDIAKHGVEFSEKTDKELINKYSHLDISDSTYAFRCGWLETDLRDIVKVIESSDLCKEFKFEKLQEF